MHEHRGCVELEGLKDVWTLVKVHHGKEELVGVELGVAVGVGHNVKLVAEKKLELKRQDILEGQ